jgi:outer membrane protein OmpA-like peptidoglycan-associated protein
MKPQFGVCGNKVGCSLAYTGEKIPASPGTPCPECGQPLIFEKASKGGSNKMVLILGLVALVVVAAIGGAIYLFKDQIAAIAGHPASTPTKIVQAPDSDDSGQVDNFKKPPVGNEKPGTADNLPPPPPPPQGNGQHSVVQQSPGNNPNDSSEADTTPIPSPGIAAATPIATPVIVTPERPSPTPASSPVAAQTPPPANNPTQDGGDVEKPSSLTKAQIDGTRQDVLKRINAMPRFTNEEKRRLTEKMETARSMDRLVVVRFGVGQTNLGKAAADDLLKRFKLKEIQDKISDPTVVFVVAGYADSAGDAKKNLQLSEQRAENITKILKDQTNLLNVIHSIGMGSTDVLDNQRSDQNRAVEIWAVAP